jgi:hypothetical protein
LDLGANDSQQIVDITDVVIRDSSNNDFSATSISRSTYFNFTTKTTSGRPTQYYFERTINPTLFLYPAADVAYTLKYYALVRMFDSGDYTNNAQIPFRFLPCMTAGLAYYISMKKSPDRLVALKQIYEDEFQRAAAQDGERTSLFLTPKTYFLEHLMSKFASGRFAKRISDRSGMAFPYNEMVEEWNGARVHYTEYERKHPQLEPRPIVNDPQALQRV